MITDIADLILKSGRSGVELALFVLLPVMIVMLTTMRLLEGWGVLDRIVAMVAPPFFALLACRDWALLPCCK